MRLLVGVLLLLLLFVAAALWQRSWTSAARSNRELARGPQTDETLPPGWSRVIVGRPSGDPSQEDRPAIPTGNPPRPIVSPEGRNPPPAAPPGAPAPGGSVQDSGTRKAARHLVLKGESLSSICTAQYGSARRELVEAVARHNGIADPNDIREGQEIVLPPEGTILPSKP